MTKKEIIAAIDAEIKWCKENRGYIDNMPEDYQNGFIDGLKQAKRLVQKIPVKS